MEYCQQPSNSEDGQLGDSSEDTEEGDRHWQEDDDQTANDKEHVYMQAYTLHVLILAWILQEFLSSQQPNVPESTSRQKRTQTAHGILSVKSRTAVPNRHLKSPTHQLLHCSHSRRGAVTRQWQTFPQTILLGKPLDIAFIPSNKLIGKCNELQAAAASRAVTDRERAHGHISNESTPTVETKPHALKYHSGKKGDFYEYEDAIAGLCNPRIWPGVETDHLAYVLARFPDNQNSLLSRTIQKQLDEKSPREYLTFVLTELSLEERESLMIDEKHRRRTFLANWPHDNNLSGIKMAQSGFYCLDAIDRVQCVFCRGSLHKWERDDNPVTEHAKSFPFCRFVKGHECGNREYKSDLLTEDDLKNATILTDLAMKKNTDGSMATDTYFLGISTNKADFTRFAPESARSRTYSRWSAQNPVSAQQLCDAGFYYTGFDDTVRCFYCSGTLREWSEGDDPFQEHARWFPDCSYIVQLKGEAYVNEVHERTPEDKKCKRELNYERKQKQRKKEQTTHQEAMVENCLKQQHDPAVVSLAIQLNNGTYKSIKDMLEVVYEIEDIQMTSGSEELDSAAVTHLRSLPTAPSKPSKMVIAEEDAGRAAEMDEVDHSRVPGRLDAKLMPQGCCIQCYFKANKTINASHIGLPCGHMILCDGCNEETKKKSAKDPTVKHRCMYSGCGAPLTATFKTFYA